MTRASYLVTSCVFLALAVVLALRLFEALYGK